MKIFELKLVCYDEYVSDEKINLIPCGDIPMKTSRIAVTDSEWENTKLFRDDLIKDIEKRLCDSIINIPDKEQ